MEYLDELILDKHILDYEPICEKEFQHRLNNLKLHQVKYDKFIQKLKMVLYSVNKAYLPDENSLLIFKNWQKILTEYKLKLEEINQFQSEFEEVLMSNKMVFEYPFVVTVDNSVHRVVIGPNGTFIEKELFDIIDWNLPADATRKLLRAVFGKQTLITHSLTGKPSPAFQGRERIHKLQLDPDMTSDIIYCVCVKSHVKSCVPRSAITMKCADAAKKFNKKLKENIALTPEEYKHIMMYHIPLNDLKYEHMCIPNNMLFNDSKQQAESKQQFKYRNCEIDYDYSQTNEESIKDFPDDQLENGTPASIYDNLQYQNPVNKEDDKMIKKLETEQRDHTFMNEIFLKEFKLQNCITDLNDLNDIQLTENNRAVNEKTDNTQLITSISNNNETEDQILLHGNIGVQNPINPYQIQHQYDFSEDNSKNKFEQHNRVSETLNVYNSNTHVQNEFYNNRQYPQWGKKPLIHNFNNKPPNKLISIYHKNRRHSQHINKAAFVELNKNSENNELFQQMPYNKLHFKRFMNKEQSESTRGLMNTHGYNTSYHNPYNYKEKPQILCNNVNYRKHENGMHGLNLQVQKELHTNRPNNLPYRNHTLIDPAHQISNERYHKEQNYLFFKHRSTNVFDIEAQGYAQHSFYPINPVNSGHHVNNENNRSINENSLIQYNNAPRTQMYTSNEIFYKTENINYNINTDFMRGLTNPEKMEDLSMMA